MSAPFSFEVVSPEALVLGGEAIAVDVPGAEGYFTAMANHAPFMTTVKPGVVNVKMEDGSVERIFVRGGFADVSPSGLTLLAEHATLVKDLDVAVLDDHIQKVREDLAELEGERRVKLERILNQLEEGKAEVMVEIN
jgi:F-type H+-transporting ATPase subunit epsilon